MRGRALLLLFGIAACSTSKGPDTTKVAQQGAASPAPAIDAAAARAAIDAQNAKFSRFLAANQADSLATMYTADAVGMYANTKAVMGRDSIVAYWRGATAAGAVKADLKTADVVVTDAGVVERGTFSFEVTPKGKKPMTDHGNYIVFWVKDGAEWKLKWDIGVTDMPPAK